VILFDLTSQQTWDQWPKGVENSLTIIRRILEVDEDHPLPVVLVGTKSDLEAERVFKRSTVLEFATNREK